MVLASPKVSFMTAHLDPARHAVISGGASGIGRAIVEALHARGTASSVLDRAPADGLPATAATSPIRRRSPRRPR